MPSDLLPTKRDKLSRRALYNTTGSLSGAQARRRRRLIPLLVSLLLLLVWYIGLFSTDSGTHPIHLLIKQANAQAKAAAASHPRTLRQAYDAYVKLNNRLPPAGFDEWYRVSNELGACRLSGFKEMRDSLSIWWALSPAEIRARNDALGVDEWKKMGFVRVRDGRVLTWEEMVDRGLPGGNEKSARGRGARDAVESMLQHLADAGVDNLPDIDWFINNLDEPAVVVPYEVRSELELLASQNETRSFEKPEPVHFALTDSFAVRRFYDNELNPTTFTVAHHKDKTQPPPERHVWDIIRASCPPTSPARTAPRNPEQGATHSISPRYTQHFTTPSVAGEAGFITDHELERRSWCDQPDMQDLSAIFIRPLSFAWTDQLLPVFTNSKVAGFNDILVPTWYYWKDDQPYHEIDDPTWNDKADNLFWKGSNTGGWSFNQEWRGWLRTRAVRHANKQPKSPSAPIQILLADKGNNPLPAKLDRRKLAAALADVTFSRPDQGDPEQEQIQRGDSALSFTGNVGFHRNYFSKLILDLDGTAYSGRFTSLMASRSAVLKARVFIEIADEALIPWFHYVPLSFRLTDMFSILGYFFGVDKVEGAKAIGLTGLASKHDKELRKIAEQGTEWSLKCAKPKAGAISYIHLLALEWGRLQSDRRDEMNFVMK